MKCNYTSLYYYLQLWQIIHLLKKRPKFLVVNIWCFRHTIAIYMCVYNYMHKCVCVWCVTCIIVQTEVYMCYYKLSNEGICKYISSKDYIEGICKVITLNRTMLHARLFIIIGSNLLLLLSLLLVYISFWLTTFTCTIVHTYYKALNRVLFKEGKSYVTLLRLVDTCDWHA